MRDENEMYRLDDNISFRKCTLFENYNELDVGDCTNYILVNCMDEPFYKCGQYGIHLHCTKHLGIELKLVDTGYTKYLTCKKCNNKIRIDDTSKLIQECKKLLNIEKFKDAKLIRLDDYYVPELSKKIDLDKKSSDYWITTDIKTDKDNDTIIVLYIGKKNSTEKIQFFIKPEKLQLSNDYKDLDPATILAKIEVTLRDRQIKQEYDEKDS